MMRQVKQEARGEGSIRRVAVQRAQEQPPGAAAAAGVGTKRYNNQHGFLRA
ncbi:MAG: hypothetical protein ACPIOQ_34135 [Promethearchaeia archaeon]